MPPELPEKWRKGENGALAASMTRRIEFVSFDAIFDLAPAAPVEAVLEANGAWTTLGTGYQQNLRSGLAAIYAIAYYLILNEDELKRFIYLPLWKKMRRRPSTIRGLRHTLRFVLKYALMSSATTSNSVSRYYTALQPLFDRGEHPRVVRKILMREGPEKMYEKAKAVKDAAKAEAAQKNSLRELNEVTSSDGQGDPKNPAETTGPDTEASLCDGLTEVMKDLFDVVVKVGALQTKLGKLRASGSFKGYPAQGRKRG